MSLTLLPITILQIMEVMPYKLWLNPTLFKPKKGVSSPLF